LRPFASTISIDEARKRLAANVHPIERTERIALADAPGRVAAAEIMSSIAVPPFARSAMDGYAVVAADVRSASRESPVPLRIVDRIYTGETSQKTIAPGTCAEIATGAPLPSGADAVVMVEETARVDDETVAIVATAIAGQNIGRQGADISPGQLVVSAGDYLNPSRIGAIAAIGRADVDVYAQPRVAIASTGNEVVAPGEALRDAHIYDVNRFTLSAVVRSHGCVAQPQPPAADTIQGLVAALDAASGADVLIFSGGSSVGERDLLVDLVAAKGTMIFHGIAVRPGKPTAFAMINGVPLFGMPGNPTSCLSNAYILLVPYLRATARLPVFAPRTVHVRLGKRIVSPAGRHQFYTVRLQDDVAMPAFKGSGEITSLSRADGYIEIPSDQSTVEEGVMVEVVLF
jgi:molybdenum cofactor synthesis domain-containing protein